MSQECRLKKTDEKRNYFLKEIEQNELISRKHKNVCTTLNYIEHFLILPSTLLDVFPFFILPFLLNFL